MARELRQDFFEYGEVSKSLQAAATSETYRRALARLYNAIVRPEGGITNRAGTYFAYDITADIANDPGKAKLFPMVHEGGGIVCFMHPGYTDGAGSAEFYAYIGSSGLGSHSRVAADFKTQLLALANAFHIDGTALYESWENPRAFKLGKSLHLCPQHNFVIKITPNVSSSTLAMSGFTFGYEWLYSFDKDHVFTLTPGITQSSTIATGNGTPITWGFTIFNTATGYEYPLSAGTTIVGTNSPLAFDVSNYVKFAASNLNANEIIKIYVTRGNDLRDAKLLGTVNGTNSTDALVYLGQPTDDSESFPFGYYTVNNEPQVTAVRFGNWARAAASFQQRLILGGFNGLIKNYVGSEPRLPNRIGFSELGNAYNFQKYSRITKDSYPFSLDLVESGRVNHIIPHKRLLIFSDGGVYNVYGTDDGSITPSSISPGTPNSYVADAEVLPVVVGNQVYFVTKSPGKLMRAQFVREINGYEFLDASETSLDLVRRGYKVKSLTYNDSIYSTVWMSHQDSDVTRMSRYVTGVTVSSKSQIQGFHQHDFGGEVLDMASVKTADGPTVTYMIVKRTKVDGTVKYYLEFMLNREVVEANADVNPSDIAYQSFLDSSNISIGTRFTDVSSIGDTAKADVDDDWEAGTLIEFEAADTVFGSSSEGDKVRFVYGDTTWDATLQTITDSDSVVLVSDEDCPSYFQGTLASSVYMIFLRNTVSCPAHLQGFSVGVMGDGRTIYNPNSPEYDSLLAGSLISLGDWYDYVYIGIPFISEVQLNRYVPIDNSEDHVDKFKNVISVDVDLQNTRGLYVSCKQPSDQVGVEGMDKVAELNEALERDLLNGVHNIPVNGDGDRNGQVLFKQVEFEPFTILSVSPQIDE